MAERDDPRQRLLDAAGATFADKGFEGATVRDIIGRAGANLAAVNYYFRDKEHLYIEAVKHAACGSVQEPALPVWEPDTPPAEKLRGFIHMLVGRMLKSNRPPWHTQLMMRELAQPTSACTEWVRDYVRPMSEVLFQILGELLPPRTPRWKINMTGFSIVGQILYYVQDRPVLTLLVGEENLGHFNADAVADHITEFTLTALGERVVSKTKRRKPKTERRQAEVAMIWIALKMLTGNRAKYYAIIFGISFASMLMTQQLSIFVGLMRNTSSQIRDIQGADIWVMDPSVQFSEDIKPLSDNDLYRVRSVPGVKWAVRLFKGMATAQLADGNFKQFSVIGLDDQTFVGAPQEMLIGSLADLRRPDAIILDQRGFEFLFPNQPLRVGWVVEMNDHRAEVVGICKSSPTFQTYPIAYTRYSQAVYYAPQERRVMSFILAQGEQGMPTEEICDRIQKRTGLLALTQAGFSWRTITYYMQRTGIPINFGITVLLGFVIGAAIAGQTFYLFTLDNLKQFGALKAMGVSNWRIVGMVLVQALVVGVLGYTIGFGLASIAEEVIAARVKGVPPAAYMAWQIPVITAAAAGLIVVVSALVSLRRVLRLEPASVFR